MISYLMSPPCYVRNDYCAEWYNIIIVSLICVVTICIIVNCCYTLITLYIRTTFRYDIPHSITTYILHSNTTYYIPILHTYITYTSTLLVEQWYKVTNHYQYYINWWVWSLMKALFRHFQGYIFCGLHRNGHFNIYLV